MKLDTLARAHANETRRSASKVRVPPVDVLMRRDRKRRWSARVAVAMSAGLASTAVMVVQGPKTIPHPLLVFRMPERHLLRTPLWQRPRAGVSLFAFEAGRDEAVELRVPDSSGAEIARGDRSWPDEPVEPTVDPILGYGDFSGVAYGDIIWSEVVGLMVECINDQGSLVRMLPSGEGVGYDVADERSRDARFAEAACRAGLNIPEPPR